MPFHYRLGEIHHKCYMQVKGPNDEATAVDQYGMGESI